MDLICNCVVLECFEGSSPSLQGCIIFKGKRNVTTYTVDEHCCNKKRYMHFLHAHLQLCMGELNFMGSEMNCNWLHFQPYCNPHFVRHMSITTVIYFFYIHGITYSLNSKNNNNL